MEILLAISILSLIAYHFFWLFLEKRKERKLKAQGICPLCEGGGGNPQYALDTGDFKEKCPACEGTGQYAPLLFQKYQQEKKWETEPAPPNPH